MTKSFESIFRYDEGGIPRLWKATDDMDSVFSRAKAESSRVLVLLGKINTSLTDLDTDIVQNSVIVNLMKDF